jgi:Ser/Thr protein kinase RdoA (MazF antagonist)
MKLDETSTTVHPAFNNEKQLVDDALRHFDINNANIEPVKASSNHVYRISLKDSIYALRIHHPNRRKPEWIDSELTWLDAIHKTSTLYTPVPAAPLYIATQRDVPICCTLLNWLEGEQILPSRITTEQAQHIGCFIAKLHHQSRSFTVPARFELPTLTWKDTSSNNSSLRIEAGDDLFSPEHQTILQQIGDRVQHKTNLLDQDANSYGVIHADLIWKNILFSSEKVGAIDFDECTWGYYLYDLAPTLLGYMDEQNYPEIREAIWDGYTSVYPQPEIYLNHLETLIAGRYALSCLWIAANRHHPDIGKRAPEIIAYRMRELQRYLETGAFRHGEIII